MSIEEILEHEAVSGCLAIEDWQYVKLERVKELIDRARKEAVAGKTVYAVYREGDNCADVEAIYADEREAYHCKDCCGADYVEAIEVKGKCDEWNVGKPRVYRAEYSKGQTADDLKEEISTDERITNFDEKDVTNAIRFDGDGETYLSLTAMLTTTHRLIFVDLMRQIYEKHDELKPASGQWYEWPAMRLLHPRKPSAFERDVYRCMMHGSAEDEDGLNMFDGMNSVITRELEDGNIEIQVPQAFHFGDFNPWPALDNETVERTFTVVCPDEDDQDECQLLHRIVAAHSGLLTAERLVEWMSTDDKGDYTRHMTEDGLTKALIKAWVEYAPAGTFADHRPHVTIDYREYIKDKEHGKIIVTFSTEFLH